MRVLRTKLSPGMILEDGAMDRDGRMLMGSGTVLTDRMIGILETARIPIVYVTDASYEECKTCPDLPELTKEQEKEIRDRFRHVNLDGQLARAVFNETLNNAREALMNPADDGQ